MSPTSYRTAPPRVRGKESTTCVRSRMGIPGSLPRGCPCVHRCLPQFCVGALLHAAPGRAASRVFTGRALRRHPAAGRHRRTGVRRHHPATRSTSAFSVPAASTSARRCDWLVKEPGRYHPATARRRRHRRVLPRLLSRRARHRSRPAASRRAPATSSPASTHRDGLWAASPTGRLASAKAHRCSPERSTPDWAT